MQLFCQGTKSMLGLDMLKLFQDVKPKENSARMEIERAGFWEEQKFPYAKVDEIIERKIPQMLESVVPSYLRIEGSTGIKRFGRRSHIPIVSIRNLDVALRKQLGYSIPIFVDYRRNSVVLALACGYPVDTKSKKRSKRNYAQESEKSLYAKELREYLPEGFFEKYPMIAPQLEASSGLGAGYESCVIAGKKYPLHIEVDPETNEYLPVCLTSEDEQEFCDDIKQFVIAYEHMIHARSQREVVETI
jgi:MrcB-like, N-terminal domain